MKDTLEGLMAVSTGQEMEADKLRLWAVLGKSEENWRRWRSGEIRLTMENVVSPLYSSTYGRFIAPQGFKGKYVNANFGYTVSSPPVPSLDDSAYRIGRTRLALGDGLPLIISPEECVKAWTELRAEIEQNARAKNILLAPCYPIVVPQLVVGDYGTTFEQKILPAVARAYGWQYSERTFVNYRQGDLAGKVGIVPESRINQLHGAMAIRPVPALYFPASVLQGYSIPADIEAIQLMPEGFILADAIAASIGLIAYTDYLAVNGQTPGYDCPANTWRSGDSLCFRADDGKLDFDGRDLSAGGSCSGGVLFVGQSLIK